MMTVQLTLEDHEVMIMRSQARMMQIFMPESTEEIDRYIAKILDATSEIGSDWRKDIGKMQRAARRAKETLAYSVFLAAMNNLEKQLAIEMQKEDL